MYDEAFVIIIIIIIIILPSGLLRSSLRDLALHARSLRHVYMSKLTEQLDY